MSLLNKILSTILWSAKKIGLIEAYAIDHRGLWYWTLPETVTELPRFAWWKCPEETGTRYLKLGGLTAIMEMRGGHHER